MPRAPPFVPFFTGPGDNKEKRRADFSRKVCPPFRGPGKWEFPSAVSPDGKFLIAGFRPPEEKTFSLAVLSIDGSNVFRELKVVDGAEIPGWVRWSPDGGSMVYIAAKGGVDNLWSQQRSEERRVGKGSRTGVRR